MLKKTIGTFFHMILKNLFDVPPHPARVAIFLSGTGSNAEALLAYRAAEPTCGFSVTLLVTDAPESSAARRIGAEWNIPLVEFDIRRFYREHGEEAIALTTARRRALREEWTKELTGRIAPHKIDLGVLAGFVPLCNIAADLPCLNVHPGDLTQEDAGGKRIFAGLHFGPVERALLGGYPELRSSVILAQPFEGNGEKERDSGPVLGVSQPVRTDLQGVSPEALETIRAARKHAPYHDRLRKIASANLERLKCEGDHVVLPRAVADFAAGSFALKGETLCYRQNDAWQEIRTVEYGRNTKRLITP